MGSEEAINAAREFITRPARNGVEELAELLDRFAREQSDVRLERIRDFVGTFDPPTGIEMFDGNLLDTYYSGWDNGEAVLAQIIREIIDG